MKRWLAIKLYSLAYWLYPDSETSNRFLQKVLWNQLLDSKAIVNIDPKKLYQQSLDKGDTDE